MTDNAFLHLLRQMIANETYKLEQHIKSRKTVLKGFTIDEQAGEDNNIEELSGFYSIKKAIDDALGE